MTNQPPSGRTRGRRRTIGLPRDNSDRKSTRLNSSHLVISYAVFCLKKKSLIIVYELNSLLTKLMASASDSLDSALTFELVVNLSAMHGSVDGCTFALVFACLYVIDW